jgi:protein Mpv17
MGIMEGRDSTHIQGKFKDMYVPAIMANWQVWPLAQASNLAFPCLSNDTLAYMFHV